MFYTCTSEKKFICAKVLFSFFLDKDSPNGLIYTKYKVGICLPDSTTCVCSTMTVYIKCNFSVSHCTSYESMIVTLTIQSNLY